MIFVAVSSAGIAWIMRDVIDSMGRDGNQSTVFLVAAGVFGIFLVKGVSTFVQVVSLSRAGNRIVAQQQIKLYDKLLRQGVSFFNLTESSDLLMQVTVSAQAARNVINSIVTSAVRDTLTLFGLLAVMFYQQPTLSLIAILIGPVAIFGVRILVKKVRSIMEKEMQSLSEIIKVIQETSAGIQIIKTFSLEKPMAERMQSAVRQVEKRANTISRLEAVTSPLMDILAGFAVASVIALSAVSLFGSEASTPGQLMSFVTALMMAYEPAKRLSRIRVSVEAGMVGVRMMFNLLDQPETLSEHTDPIALPDGGGEIAFNNVSFSYGTDRKILTDMSLMFEAGKTTALVGPSGGGKSTILNLAMRLYDPQDGQITINQADVKTATFDSLRSMISFVGQNTFLFSASVAENIRIGRPEATEEEIEAAAKEANAYEFIVDLPKGFHTHVGENGAFLSGGQKQRIAIARALLRDCPILLLDEATSSLDSHSEKLIQDALRRLTKGRTTAIIAHRLSTVLEADQIYVIDGGRVIENGTAQELLENRGTFFSLYSLQYGSAIALKADQEVEKSPINEVQG
ncbi:MAG: ABC transporter ATP-binding protein [Rhodobacteraceae bacterium]|nr:ABC transporter ATP-binding protein [Paracoccaceae bacterium]